VEAEGPSRGFSDIVWKESLPSALSAQSWWELVQQSLTIMVAKKATTWRITNTEITQVSPPLLLRRERDLKKGILWSWRTARSTDNRADGGGGGGGGGGSGGQEEEKKPMDQHINLKVKGQVYLYGNK